MLELDPKDLELDVFDPAEHLDSPEVIQAYLDEAVASGDPAFIADSLGVIARAKGMTELANKTGLSRETLYRTLSKKGNPNLKTLMAVTKALDVHVNIGSVA
ncbi:addiction module antidote protein [Vibrio vulnificus]|uniref:addiction module antidote protein n=1 Tax=Vibrio vulnificus TaxID=672 RepID=UPI0032427B91